MTKQIFKSICFVAAIVFVASFALIINVMYKYFSGVQQQQLRTDTLLVAKGVYYAGLDYIDESDLNNYRITWIAADGQVLYDSKSDISEMDNHLDREEIHEALINDYGESIRYSTTLTKQFFYSAKRLPDGTVIRLSGSQSNILALTLYLLQPVLLIVALAVVLSLVLAFRLSKKIMEPLNKIDLDKPLLNKDYTEISPLLERIHNQQLQLKESSLELKLRREEFETVTNSMNEGMVLLNKRGRILSINNKARQIISADCELGDSIYTVNDNLNSIHEMIDRARGGQRSEKIESINEKNYHVNVNPIITNGAVSGVAIVIIDITGKEEAEQIRREFTANVSHELKTPLHSISGYAELLKNGMVKNEDIERFSWHIYSEAQRMICLVDDIINLSRLDEGIENIDKERIDLHYMAQEIIKELAPIAAENNVTVSLRGEQAYVFGIPQLIDGIIYNLCDNAIKYNRPNGNVEIETYKEGSTVVLSVKDNGIGIADEHKERIFERFYRVDKSHSRNIGGTGLGLSIVKHAARIHGAAIELESMPEAGTTIKVTFNAV